MSGYGYGGEGYGYPPHHHHHHHHGEYPPPPGAYPPPPGPWTPPNRGKNNTHTYPPHHHHHHHHREYPPPPGAYPPPLGPWTPPNRGYGWYQWDRPSHCTGEYHWIHCEAGQIPYHAVHAGRDKDGGPLYAGRAYYDGDLLPAKVAPYHHKAYVPYGGREHSIHQFEVLVSEHTAWQEDCHGRVPMNAIVIGQSRDGENLYMGRVMHDGTLTPGKIQPSNECIYIPYGGDEIKYREYEVLILN